METTTTPPTTSATGAPSSAGWLETLLNPSHRGSTHRTEFLAGLTTFVTMSYIIFVNTAILQAAGLNQTALIIGTIFAAVVPTLFMGLWADLPWALAPGMGYNALFAYTVVQGRGIPVGAALALVFLDGLAFTLVALGPWRENIIKGIPLSLKLAAGAGIGLFIAFIGMNNADLISIGLNSGPAIKAFGGGPLSAIGNLSLARLNDPVVIVALIGIVITAVLLAWRVRAGLLLGIILTAAVAWASALIFPSTRAPLGIPATPTSFSDFIAWPDFATFWSKGVGRIDFAGLFSGHIASGAILLFFLTFLVTDMMDSFGTFSGLAAKLGILDKDGNFPRSGRALIVDAVAGMWGPVTGNATIATFIESASGVGEGGKTGLTSVWVAFFFLISLLFVPFVGLIPGVATAPALIVVGFLMIEPIVKVAFQDITDGLPAFLALITMPVTYSIADGMFMGIASYVILKLATGRAKEISWVMWVFAILLILAKVLDASGL